MARPLLVVGTAALVLAILVIVLRVSAATQAQDPALDPALGDVGSLTDEGPTLRDSIPGEG